jgi:hypothetical protein
MSINQTLVEKSVPSLQENEYRIIERKDIKAYIEFMNDSFSEEGILFLTNKRLVFLSQTCMNVKSFECDINKTEDCVYYKKNNSRILEGYTFPTDNNTCPYKFSFHYTSTGFRSLVSIFFSILDQVSGSGRPTSLL